MTVKRVVRLRRTVIHSCTRIRMKLFLGTDRQQLEPSEVETRESLDRQLISRLIMTQPLNGCRAYVNSSRYSVAHPQLRNPNTNWVERKRQMMLIHDVNAGIKTICNGSIV